MVDTHPADGTLDSPEQFVAAWIEALRQAGHPGTFEAGEGIGLVRVEKGQRVASFKGGHVYKNYLEVPEDRDKHLTILVSMVQGLEKTSTHRLDMSRLVPIIRPRAVFESLGMDLPIMHLVDDLHIHLVEDQGESLRYTRYQDLESTGQPFQDLLHQAIDNLRAIAPMRADDLGDGFMLVSGGDYESSLILDRPLIDTYAQRLGGEVDLSIPTRDLFVISRKGPGGLQLQARIIANGLERPDALFSSKIYTYREDNLVGVAKVHLDEQGQIHLTTLEV